MAELRALTVRQPWAACIAHLDKRVENRPKPFPAALLGEDIAIHAALAVDDVTDVPDGEAFTALFASGTELAAWCHRKPARTPRVTADWPARLPLGAVVAVARVTGCHGFDYDELCGYSGDWSEGSRHPGLCSPWVRPGDPWHWELADVRPLAKPVPHKGALGLLRLPEDVEAAVRAQLEEGS